MPSKRVPFSYLLVLGFVLTMVFRTTAAQADLSAGSFVFNGGVAQVVHDVASGDTYVGGSFTSELPATGAGVVANSSSGTLDANASARLSGAVVVTVSDGTGGWYVGGSFEASDGQQNLVHIESDGQLDTTFAPNPSSPLDPPSGVVQALALSGGVLYVGGEFSSLGGQQRQHLGAVDSVTGMATDWSPSTGAGFVSALAVSGATVYVGGGFTTMGGAARNDLAAVDVATGDATAWNPAPDQIVGKLAVSGSTLYVSGSFFTIAGQARSHLAAFDTATGNMTAWNPTVSGVVDAFAFSDDTVYLGGSFSDVGGQARSSLVAVDNLGGAPTSWNPGVTRSTGYPGSVNALALVGSTIYVGGDFASASGQGRANAAAININTGAATAWQPNPGGRVSAMAAGNGSIYIGGDFAGAGTPLAQVASLARVTANGSLDTSWDPELVETQGPVPIDDPASVDALVLSGSTLYVAGNFSSVGGQNRHGLVAIGTASGDPTSWNPDVSGSVLALASSGSSVYLGGAFTAVGGAARGNLAAVDATTGAVASWNPNVTGGSVKTLAVSGSSIYVGGDFDTIGGQTRVAAGAVDVTGAVTSWDPAIPKQGYVYVAALAVSNSSVYLGGQFSQVGGVTRIGAAAVDTAHAATLPWNPSAGFSTIRIVGPSVYLGGQFSQVGAYSPGGLAARSGLASVDVDTGSPMPWDAHLDGASVTSLDVSGSTLYVGGSFAGVDGVVTGPYTQLPIDGVSTPSDTTAPIISISSPTEGQHVAQGASVATHFSCDDADSGVASCSGAASLDTSLSGSMTFTVVATDNAGNSTSRSVGYVVDATAAPDDGDHDGGDPGQQPTPPAVIPDPGPIVPSPIPTPIPPPKSPAKVAPVAAVKLTIASSVARAALGHGLSLTLNGARPKSAYTATLRAGHAVLATVKGHASKAGKIAVKLKLSKAALVKAKRQKKLGLQLRVVAANGKTKTVEQTIRMR